MIINSELTVYHKEFDESTRLEKWTRFNYENIWWFGGKGSSINKGYENANDVDIRIPYNLNENVNINNFSIGDILYKGKLEKNIIKQSDVPNAYNITSINDNTFGSEPHVHLGGK